MAKTFPAAADYSWSRPDPAYIALSGYIGVGRYIGYDTVNTPRDITKAEMDSLHNAGLKVFFIVQGDSNTVRAGWDKGVQHAEMANDILGSQLRVPENVWIVSTVVDYQASHADLVGGIADYARGFQSRCRWKHIPYGPDYALDTLCGELHLFSCGWQTRAWSGTRVSKYACMTQEVGYVLGESSDHNNIINLDDAEKLLWHPSEDAHPIVSKDPDMPITMILTSSRANRAWLTERKDERPSIGEVAGLTNEAGEPIDGNGNVLPDGWSNPYAGLAAWECQDTHFDIRMLSPEHHQWLLAIKYVMAMQGKEPTIIDAGFVNDDELRRRTFKPSDKQL